MIQFIKLICAYISIYHFQLLGVAGYDQLLNAPTNLVMDKVLQLVGQKHVDGYPASLYNEIILAVSVLFK